MTRELPPPPRLGQHNREVLQGLLGVSNEYLATLVEDGVIGDRPATRLPSLWKKPLPMDEMIEYHAVRPVPEAFERMSRHFGTKVGPDEG
jgi:hypothetical protein